LRLTSRILFTLLENGEAEEIQGMRVTANFFSVLKIKPVRGREFTGEEEKRGSPTGNNHQLRILAK
jgi:hypothetical protein